ncbi:hypothetical protein K488DRAFT_78742 [Vararia minispora EC-137]|uniref:Uncharacterized protein n=1 Tax=Vararia minispora EC-137 TaxID=1314806 RepID=A0ACB8QK94_9AGAM|nr:hypothetical protein K488DRAFT_78742 [Vararia minispora EC-137]
MTTILDDDLFKHAERVMGKVVVLTGGGNGIGKETAKTFAKYGAKVMIGDLDTIGGEATVAEIQANGGEAAFILCDVLNWDDQVALFDCAIERFGSVDIVVANAGLTERGDVCQGILHSKDGRPQPPPLLTLRVNLVGVFYTCDLALYHIKRTRTSNDLKAIVLLGSMASWQSIPRGPEYSASKHAVLGLMRSLHRVLEPEHIRLAVIHPWFADTKIVPTSVKLALAGIPLTPVPRIAGAIFCAATEPDPTTSGCAWVLPDDGPVFRLAREELTTGVYALINARAQRAQGVVQSIVLTFAFFRDIARIVGPGKIVVAFLAAAGALAVRRGFVKLPF